MSEVEKIYKNAGVEKKEKGYCDCDYMNCPYPEIDPCGKECPYWVSKGIDYPPFTAEKQLELYKYLCKPFLITTRYYFDEFSITAENTFEWKPVTKVSATGKTYEECIAKLVNNLWQDLTEEDKQQIRGILE